VLIEAEAIPYEPASLRGERLLVLAPHPDDEVIACGGLIALHRAERRAVRVAVATDGSGAGDKSVREEESRRGLDRLSDGIDLRFWGFADRGLGPECEPVIREELLAFRPDLVVVPSPVEIHPDHAALARAFISLVQRDPSLFSELATTRVAFYEVSQPLRPNALVDITPVAEAKYAAIAAHVSQLEQRSYIDYAKGLNAYRTMTLPPECTFAEAYFVIDMATLRTTPASQLQHQIGTSGTSVEVAEPSLPISVIIRTKDRPALLAEAVASVRATGYPCEIVVVNDGGAPLDPAIADILVEHEESLGRSEAANAGVRAASHPFICFLDDDDLFYPEHLVTLARASSSAHAAWYTDAVSTFLEVGETGAYEVRSRMRIYEEDFDRELLLVDNYIPLPTLLLRRETFLRLGGFDPSFDLFEDWDFLIRLSAEGDFLRVPRLTCAIRHFKSGSSVVLAAPEGSDRFRAAKLRIWQKHSNRMTADVFATVYERQKRRSIALYSDLQSARGESSVRELDIARLEREKQQLLVQNVDTSNLINGYALRVRELEGVVTAHTATIEADITRGLSLVQEINALNVQRETLLREHEELRQVHGETSEALERTRVEVARLNGLLTMIFQSRTWKVHTVLEKLRGRG
jgi:LmbE family N-acetylglucosaminyl deacetylase/glycosyltransferase involved in cell wall biosynthesis